MVAGHGQRAGTKSLLYHGVIALYPWNTERIEEVLNLPSGEIEVVRQLPAVNDFVSLTHDEFAKELIEKFGAVTLEDALFEEKCLKGARKLVREKYAHREWIENGDAKQYKGLGFCFVAIRPHEKKHHKDFVSLA